MVPVEKHWFRAWLAKVNILLGKKGMVIFYLKKTYKYGNICYSRHTLCFDS